MTPEQTAALKKGVQDIMDIVACAISGNDIACLPPALDLGRNVLDLLPPIDAPALTTSDRADVDATVAAEEDAKFPPKAP